MTIDRRSLLTGLAAFASGLGMRLAAQAQSDKKRVAAIVNCYYAHSHADVIVGRFLHGYAPNGVRIEPHCRIVSMYTDQIANWGRQQDLSRALSKKHGFQLMTLPVTHPGVEQKATWLQIRQNRPDYVLLWGWGVMNSTAIKEAVAVNYPRDQMYGGWWSGAEPDVLPAEAGAKGYNSAALQHSAGQVAVHKAILQHVYEKNKGSGKREEVGTVLYNRGMINAMVTVEAIRTAQAKFGKKPLTGEQVRWGIENLKLDAARIKALGFEGLLQPIQVTCRDHEGVRIARIHQWDGKKWSFVSDWIKGNEPMLRAMVEEAAKKYAAEKKITPRDCSKES